jgi:hypothetical protein
MLSSIAASASPAESQYIPFDSVDNEAQRQIELLITVGHGVFGLLFK